MDQNQGDKVLVADADGAVKNREMGKGKEKKGMNKGECFACGSPDHWKKNYPQRKRVVDIELEV